MNDTPQTEPDLDAASLELLRRAGVERQDLGERLARHEFRAIQRELSSEHPFSLRVDLNPSSIGAFDGLTLPEALADPEAFASLPSLPVPLGRIAWVGRPQDLPVAGILVPHMPERPLADMFLSLLTEHHRTPFARLVFLCRDLTPVHCLGRYGFISHDVGDVTVPVIGGIMKRRYGMSQIRALDSGRKLWEP